MGEFNAKESGVLAVGGGTPTRKLASSIAASCTKEGLNSVKIRGIGAAAVNQMVKATILAGTYLSQKGVGTEIKMCFKDVDNNITAIEFELTFKR